MCNSELYENYFLCLGTIDARGKIEPYTRPIRHRVVGGIHKWAGRYVAVMEVGGIIGFFYITYARDMGRM